MTEPSARTTAIDLFDALEIEIDDLPGRVATRSASTPGVARSSLPRARTDSADSRAPVGIAGVAAISTSVNAAPVSKFERNEEQPRVIIRRA